MRKIELFMFILIGIAVISNLLAFDKTEIVESKYEKINALYYYDTTKDDIPGGWKSNANLSWYNEPSNPSDDFLDGLDSNRWEMFHSVEIDSGRVRFSGTVLQGYWHAGELNSQNEWSLSSDFDIQITYFSFDAENKGELRLEIKGYNDPGHFLFVSRAIDGSGEHKYLRSDYNNNYAEVSTSDTEGRLRIVRTGSTVRTYYGYWQEGSNWDEDTWKWEMIGSHVDFGTDTVYVRIFTTSVQSGVHINAEVDDFIADFDSGCDFPLVGSSSRSTKREFPDRALLVASNRVFDIIDADDNTVWMRFNAYDINRDIAKYQNVVADTVSYVYAKNGKIYLGCNTGWMSGMEVMDFTTDDVWFYDTHTGDGTGWNFLGNNISERNMNRGWTDNTANYPMLEGPGVYNVRAKKINNKTYVAVANGLKENLTPPPDSLGCVTVICLEDNTKSYDVLTESSPVIDVAISENSDNYLYYLTEDNLYCSYSDWLSSGDIGTPDVSITTSTTNQKSKALAINNNNIFVGNEDETASELNGSVTKRNLSTLAVVDTYNLGTDLNGTSNITSLFADDNTLWAATSNSSEGKINVIGLANPKTDDLRGVFDVPDYLESHRPIDIAYCQTVSGKEFIAVAYDDNPTTITVLTSTDNEISLSSPLEGKIQYNFTDGTAFDYDFQDVTVTLDPPDSKATYGNVSVIMHNSAPTVPFPDHALTKWFEIESEAGFDAFPVGIHFEFTNPTPDGDNGKELFYSTDNGANWNYANDDPQITDISWNYVTSPYYVDFSTSHFSYWGMSNGDGSDPLPVVLSDFFAVFSEDNLSIHWITESETNSAGWNLYKSDKSNFETSYKINNTIIAASGNSSTIHEYVYYDKTQILPGNTYYYWLENVQYDGTTTLFTPTSISIPEDNNEDIPELNFIGITQNYPNPFNPITYFSCALDYDSYVSLNIYNIKGEKVKTLYQGNLNKNKIIKFVWNATDNNNKKLPSGIYIYKFITQKDVFTKKMMLIK